LKKAGILANSRGEALKHKILSRILTKI
jgi:hypothetical protein